PSGLTATAISGTGWSCTLGTLTCTRSDALAANSSYPDILVTVTVSATAASSLNNTASVSGGGDVTPGNNGPVTDTTIVTPIADSSSYPDIILTVTVSATAAASLDNAATVSGGGDLTPGNDGPVTDTTTIIQVADLSITKSHSGNFAQGQVGATYTLTVSNA